LKRSGRQWSFRVFANVPHDIHLAPATGAGTTAPQFFQWNEVFAVIVPLNRQFGPDNLNIHRSHAMKLSPTPSIRSIIPTLFDSNPRCINLHSW
jgi:hypothetical protein